MHEPVREGTAQAPIFGFGVVARRALSRLMF